MSAIFDELFGGVQLSEDSTAENAWLVLSAAGLVVSLRLLTDSQPAHMSTRDRLFLQRNFLVTCILQSLGLFISAIAWGTGYDDIAKTVVVMWPSVSGPVLLACLAGWVGLPESYSTKTVGMDRWLSSGVNVWGKLVFVVASLLMLFMSLRFGDIIVSALNVGASAAMLLGAHRKAEAKLCLRRGKTVTEVVIPTPTAGSRTNGYEFMGRELKPVEISGKEWKYTDDFSKDMNPLIALAKKGNFVDFIHAATPVFSKYVAADGEGLVVQSDPERLEEALLALRDAERRTFKPNLENPPTTDVWYVAAVLQAVQYRLGPRLNRADDRFDGRLACIGRAMTGEFSGLGRRIDSCQLMSMDDIVVAARQAVGLDVATGYYSLVGKPDYSSWLKGFMEKYPQLLTKESFIEGLGAKRNSSVPLVNLMLFFHAGLSAGLAIPRVDEPRPVKSKMEDARMLHVVLEQASWSQGFSAAYVAAVVLGGNIFASE